MTSVLTPVLSIIVLLFVIQIYFLIVNAVNGMKLKQLAESTHIIVNSQRTMLLRLIAALSRRIANENPSDSDAQDAATVAEQEAVASDYPRRNLM